MSQVTLNHVTVDLPHPTRRKIIKLSEMVETAAKLPPGTDFDFCALHDLLFEIVPEILHSAERDKNPFELFLLHRYLDDADFSDVAFELISQMRPDAYNPVIQKVLGKRD